MKISVILASVAAGLVAVGGDGTALGVIAAPRRGSSKDTPMLRWHH
jgi:hypothetical protein